MNTEEKYSTIDDVAEYFAVSVSTVRKWLRQKLITHASYLKVGNTFRFKISLVEQDLKEGAEDSPELPDQDALNEEPPEEKAKRLSDSALAGSDFSEDRASTIYALTNPAFPFLTKLAHFYDDQLDWLEDLNSNPCLPAGYEVEDSAQFLCDGKLIFDALLSALSLWRYGDKTDVFLLNYLPSIFHDLDSLW